MHSQWMFLISQHYSVVYIKMSSLNIFSCMIFSSHSTCMFVILKVIATLTLTVSRNVCVVKWGRSVIKRIPGYYMQSLWILDCSYTSWLFFEFSNVTVMITFGALQWDKRNTNLFGSQKIKNLIKYQWLLSCLV